MNRLQPLDTLEFNQNRVLHHEVDPIAPFKLKPSVDNRDRNLTGHARSACRQFLEEAGLINGFQQARAQSRVYLERGSDDLS